MNHRRRRLEGVRGQSASIDLDSLFGVFSSHRQDHVRVIRSVVRPRLPNFHNAGPRWDENDLYEQPWGRRSSFSSNQVRT
jgi:hypothetical protein